MPGHIQTDDYLADLLTKVIAVQNANSWCKATCMTSLVDIQFRQDHATCFHSWNDLEGTEEYVCMEGVSWRQCASPEREERYVLAGSCQWLVQLTLINPSTTTTCS